MNEAARQQALLRLLGTTTSTPLELGALGLREAGERAVQGVQAYLTHRDAVAQRALTASFATVHRLIGTADFARLASEYWVAHPPVRGDLGEWGDTFAAWLQARPQLAAWPWLGDCARLDWAVHRNERAPDAVLDVASLARLESDEPKSLRLQLMPGCAVLNSPWPIASLLTAHRLHGDDAERAFARAREAIQARRGEQLLVFRQGWRAEVQCLSPAQARFMQALLDAANLEEAVQAAGSEFEFADWLGDAVHRSWLKGVASVSD